MILTRTHTTASSLLRLHRQISNLIGRSRLTNLNIRPYNRRLQHNHSGKVQLIIISRMKRLNLTLIIVTNSTRSMTTITNNNKSSLSRLLTRTFNVILIITRRSNLNRQVYNLRMLPCLTNRRTNTLLRRRITIRILNNMLPLLSKLTRLISLTLLENMTSNVSVNHSTSSLMKYGRTILSTLLRQVNMSKVTRMNRITRLLNLLQNNNRTRIHNSARMVRRIPPNQVVNDTTTITLIGSRRIRRINERLPVSLLPLLTPNRNLMRHRMSLMIHLSLAINSLIRRLTRQNRILLRNLISRSIPIHWRRSPLLNLNLPRPPSSLRNNMNLTHTHNRSRRRTLLALNGHLSNTISNSTLMMTQLTTATIHMRQLLRRNSNHQFDRTLPLLRRNPRFNINQGNIRKSLALNQ